MGKLRTAKGGYGTVRRATLKKYSAPKVKSGKLRKKSK